MHCSLPVLARSVDRRQKFSSCMHFEGDRGFSFDLHQVGFRSPAVHDSLDVDNLDASAESYCQQPARG